MFSGIFIDRPRFAIVIAVVITLAGLIAIRSIPIAQFPDVVPPQVSLTANYPGADPEVIENTVAQPISLQCRSSQWRRGGGPRHLRQRLPEGCGTEAQ
jgi:HAE1 family hydrophobic/amphiphilic exporter-1